MNIQQFSQQGKRSNNEDSLGMSAALLTVCDGMGGHNYGERASAFVKEAMLKAFAEPKPLGKMEIQQQLNQVQADLNQLLEKEPELEKMGTTFTGVFITSDVWYAAHIGDSRIYLFRPSEQKLWHTWDHSLVGELMRTKEITIEAGRFHPMSNRISKAIIAQKDGKPASASIVKIDELKKGDILLLCSDGVVEGWGDWELVQLFSDTSFTFEQKCEKLAQHCNVKSKDNNTAIIAEIEEEDAFSFGTNEELDWTTFPEVEADYQQYVKDNEEVKEEAPKPAAPANPQRNEVTTRQEAKKPETPQAPKPQPRPVAATRPTPKPQKRLGKTEKKSINKLFSLLAALLLVTIIGVVMLLKSKKPDDINPDTQAYEACKTVADYRNYLSDFGRNARHYTDAKAFVENYEADSIQKAKEEKNKADAKAAQDELERKEKKAYNACTTITACESYLRVYPNGKYVKEVKATKKRLEQAQEEAETKAQAEAEKKEKAAYDKCTTIVACEEYLKEYPHGRYKADVQNKKAELEAQVKAEAAQVEAEAKKNEQKKKEQETETQSEKKTDDSNQKTPDNATKPEQEPGTPNPKSPSENTSKKLENLTPEQKERLEESSNQKTHNEKKNNATTPDTGKNKE